MFYQRLSLLFTSYFLTSPHRSAARALALGSLPNYLQTHYASDMTAYPAFTAWLKKSLPLLSPHMLSAIRNHPFFAHLLSAGLIKYALEHHNDTYLRILGQSDVFLNQFSFEKTMYQASLASLTHPRLTSLVLATAADSHISAEKWEDYAKGLVTATRQAGPRFLAWAHMSDLPVVENLPVMEAATESYGTIPDNGSFLLLLNIARARTAHEQLNLQSILENWAPTAEDCLTTPSSSAYQRCLTLKGI